MVCVRQNARTNNKKAVRCRNIYLSFVRLDASVLRRVLEAG